MVASRGDAHALELIHPDGKHQIKFDIKISTPNGTLFTIYVKCTQEKVVNMATARDKVTKQAKRGVQQAHEKLGHVNEKVMTEIAKNIGWTLADNQPLSCAACAAGKANQKLLKKVSVLDLKDEKDGYRAYLDISTIKNKKISHSHQSKLKVDCCWDESSI